jgi:hypothetical protein
MERLRQLRLVWRQVREIDPMAARLVILMGLAGAVFGAAVGWVIGVVWSMPLWAVLFGLLAALATFNWRAQRAQFAALAGHVGAAAAVLDRMRGQWIVRPAVAFSGKQDMVHRVVGRCGVVLVGEGSPARVRTLLTQERKRLARVVGDAPMTLVVVGDGEGEVALPKLQMALAKLPRRLSKGQVTQLDRRLRPLDRSLPIPKGIDPGTATRPRPRPR